MATSALRVFLIFIIVFSCLAHGSVTILPITITETAIALAMFVWLAGMLYKHSLSFIKTGLSVPIVLFLGVVFFQLLYLPLGVIRLLSANTANLYKGLIPPDASRGFFTLSIYPNATIFELLKTTCFIGLFFIVINNMHTKQDFGVVINIIIFFGLGVSLFGIIQKYSHSSKIYWFDFQEASYAFGPFVNRNNFAGYINMIIPLALGYFLTDIPLSKRFIYGTAIGIMSLALFLSLSRAGILVYMSTVLFLLLLSRSKEHFKQRTGTVFILLILVFSSFALFMEPKVVLERMLTLFKRETFVAFGHGYSWLDVLKIWRDFPIFGTGLGTFGNISAMYNSLPAQESFTYAHNDYLQLLSEAGLMGFLLIVWFFIVYFYSVLETWFRRHDSYVVCLVLGGLASLFAMLIYSLLDFNLHIPANAVLFFIIMGLVYRLAFTRFDHVKFR